MRENILITGGAGMVGSIIDFGVKPSRSELDILKPENIIAAIRKYKPEVLIHLAANTSVVDCEADPEGAYAANTIGTYNIAKVCKQAGLYLIYLSTAMVFDGNKASPYLENDLPQPINVYGRTKYIGELVVRDLAPDSLVVRTGWLFGGGAEVDKKFVGYCVRALSSGETIRALDCRFGSPTYVPDMILAIRQLIEKRQKRIIHVVNSGHASYFEIASEIKKIGKFKSEVLPTDIDPVGVKRGRMEALISEKVKLRPWQEALTDYVKSRL